MNYEEKLALARLCYKKISEVIQECEALGATQCCWDRCIGVDDEFFTERLLEEED